MSPQTDQEDTRADDPRNIDARTVEGFGEEWSAFAQDRLTDEEYQLLYDSYFSIFSFDSLPPNAEGFDLGCGSGRWAERVAPRVGTLHCIDPSEKALDVTKRRLAAVPNVTFDLAGASNIPLPDDSQDFGYSLGVLHHIPDTAAALAACVKKLKRGAPFLVYLYYSFDNRPWWFRTIWKGSDMMRQGIARLPFAARRRVTDVLAATVYWPLARTARGLERTGMNVDLIPLSAYRHCSFYTMRTDSLDRFGTGLEHRFSRAEIERMMREGGLENIRFSDNVPFWVACGTRA